MVVRIVNAPPGFAAYARHGKVEALVSRGDARWVGAHSAEYSEEHIERITEQAARPKEYFGGKAIHSNVIEVPYHPIATGHQGLSGASGFRTWQMV